MEKIKMQTPLVEMDGDEMTRILWQIIKDELLTPYLDLNTEFMILVLSTEMRQMIRLPLMQQKQPRNTE